MLFYINHNQQQTVVNTKAEISILPIVDTNLLLPLPLLLSLKWFLYYLLSLKGLRIS